MASTRTLCTECKSAVTLPEPAEVGDVVACPKCEAYFTVPRTKIVPTPGAAKPAQAMPARPMAATPAKPLAAIPAKPKPKVVVEVEDDDEEDFTPPPPKKKPVVVVEDDDDDEDDEDDERPRKKKRPDGGGKKKKKRKGDDEGGFRNSPLRFVILGVLLVVLGVGIYLLSKKEWRKPDIVLPAKEEDFSKPITPEEIKANVEKVNKNKGKAAPLIPAASRIPISNDLQQIAKAYILYSDTNGRSPRGAVDMQGVLETPKLLQSVTDGTYVFLWSANLKQVPDGASSTILGYSRDTPESGGLAVMVDGSVKQVTAAEYAAAPKVAK